MPGPHTDKKAKGKYGAETCSPCMLIDTTDANIRCSTVSGTFLVAQGQAPFILGSKRVIEVVCWWYHWKPKRRFIRLILNNGEMPYVCNKIGIPFITNIER